MKEAVTVEYALQFDQTNFEPKITYLSEQPINMITDKNKRTAKQDKYAKLQKTVEDLAK